jgi:hypothetical protein
MISLNLTIFVIEELIICTAKNFIDLWIISHSYSPLRNLKKSLNIKIDHYSKLLKYKPGYRFVMMGYGKS